MITLYYNKNIKLNEITGKKGKEKKEQDQKILMLHKNIT